MLNIVCKNVNVNKRAILLLIIMSKYDFTWVKSVIFRINSYTFYFVFNAFYYAGHCTGQQFHQLEKSRSDEQSGEGQEADHHGGCHGKQAQHRQLHFPPPFPDCLLPCDLVSLCLCLHSRDCWLHPPDHPLLLHIGHPHHAHQDSRLH